MNIKYSDASSLKLAYSQTCMYIQFKRCVWKYRNVWKCLAIQYWNFVIGLKLKYRILFKFGMNPYANYPLLLL